MEKYYIETFGCQMNVHESEKLAGVLVSMGYEETTERAQAKVIVFNTCCIRDTAEKKIFGNIGELKILKREYNLNKKYANVEQVPFVDIILGTSNIHLLQEKIKNLLERRARGRGKVISIDKNEKPEVNEEVVPYRTSYPNAWVNIMYGCNNFCAYCIVPYVRGRERSRDPEVILQEVESLVKLGYKEITLLGQNVNSFCWNQTKNKSETAGQFSNSENDKIILFPELMKMIAEHLKKTNSPIKWVRFMSSHPKDLSDELIQVISEEEVLCKHIHLPVQAGSSSVLERMNRRYTRQNYLDLVDRIRAKIPEVSLTTDILIGFPGETEDEFEETVSLMKEVNYLAAYMYYYNPREGTPACTYENQIPMEINRPAFSSQHG